MGDREISFLQEEDTVCRSLHHPSAACEHPCAAANSAKRHSPLKLQEPAPKRAAAVHPLSSPTTAAAEARGLLGYQKLTLPQSSFSSAAAAPPPLRRTLSEPVYSPGTGAITTRTPPPRGKISESPRCGESPSAKRLKRMKERLREMEKWWNEVAAEDDDDSENDKAPKEEENEEGDDAEKHHPAQEAVFVEKSGECLVLHFNCPCGNGYQILLSGNNCYYKLTTFPNC